MGTIARSGTISDIWTGSGNSLGGSIANSTCNVDVFIQDSVGNPPLSDYGWHCGNSNAGVEEVGLKLSNGFDLHDMHGNLWEWTSDFSTCSYPSSNGDWCSSGSYRVRRGGGWNDYPNTLKTAGVGSNLPYQRNAYFGFRLRKLTGQ